MFKKSKELADLWITVSIAGTLSAYHLLVQFNSVLSPFFDVERSLWWIDLILKGLYLWMLSLLFIAYKRWVKSLGRQKELEALISSSGLEVVLVVDKRRRIVSCNESVVHIFGYKSDEVIGETTEFLYGDRRQNPNVTGEIYKVLDTIGFHVGEARGIHKEGHIIALEIVTVEKKDFPGVVILIKDITARKRAEKTILDAKDKIEQAYQKNQKLLHELEHNYTKLQELESSRDTLTHMIVHDMKTPLQVLSLNAELLQERATERLEKSERKSLDDIRSYCTRLDVMMKSMLDISRMKEQHMTLHPHLHDPALTLERAIDMLGNSKMNHVIRILRPGNLPPIEYDDELIQRVLINLLINAIKYSPNDTLVEAEVTVLDGAIEFAIRDEGPGIPADQQSRIFEKFEQLQGEDQHVHGSSGLGLAYCRLAINAHKGAIGVRSDGETGSTFWFSLPMQSFVSDRLRQVDKRHLTP